MSRKNQEEVLDWIRRSTQGIALFIEPIGTGDALYFDGLKANKKSYYDNLFQTKGLEVIKEGRFLWHDADKDFCHYTETDYIKVVVQFNRTYYWIVS